MGTIKLNPLNKFSSFKLVTKKQRISTGKVSNRVIKGICIREDDNFRIRIKSSDVKDIIPNIKSDEIILDFTEDSYNLKGVQTVFNRKADENGRYICIIRDINDCKVFYGSEENYVPFWHGWICSGFIIKNGSKYLFKFKDCTNALINNDE